jgi:Amt family ammonium transporter
VAGLVGMTPAAGFVTPMSALAVGFITGVVCFFAVTQLKKALGYDDSLDAFGVHGIGGFTGALLTGIFANSAVNTVFKDSAGAALPSGLIEGNPKQLLNQLIASIFAIVLGGVGSYIILKIVDLTVGVRVSGEDETAGLDISQHGEEGYNLDMDLVSSEAYTYSGSGAPIAEPAMRTASALEK